MRLVHGSPGVFLRAAGGPADHFRDQVFESRRGHTMVRFIDPGIRVQSRVDHDAVNEVIDDGGDGVDAAEAFVKCGGLWYRIRPYTWQATFSTPSAARESSLDRARQIAHSKAAKETSNDGNI